MIMPQDAVTIESINAPKLILPVYELTEFGRKDEFAPFNFEIWSKSHPEDKPAVMSTNHQGRQLSVAMIWTGGVSSMRLTGQYIPEIQSVGSRPDDLSFDSGNFEHPGNGPTNVGVQISFKHQYLPHRLKGCIKWKVILPADGQQVIDMVNTPAEIYWVFPKIPKYMLGGFPLRLLWQILEQPDLGSEFDGPGQKETVARRAPSEDASGWAMISADFLHWKSKPGETFRYESINGNPNYCYLDYSPDKFSSPLLFRLLAFAFGAT